MKFLRHWLRARLDRRLPRHLRDARKGEDLAYNYLRRRGYTIVARNYRPRSGKQELDLVAWDKEQLAVIEVKTRASDEFGEPARAVDLRKRRYLIRAAAEYVRRAGVNAGKLRFDIVNVVLEDEARVQFQKDAFARRSVDAQGRKRLL